MLFNKIVTTTKRNHIYYGPTQSQKIATTLEEIDVDINNAYEYLNSQTDELAALASGYFTPSGVITISKSRTTEIENILDKMAYIEATTDPIY